MYYPKYHIIFVGINKTGSSSALLELKKYFYYPEIPERWQYLPGDIELKKDRYLKHAQAFFYYHSLGAETFRKCYSFSFVRNPWDKMVSTFFFRCRSPEDFEIWKGPRRWFIENGLPGPTDAPPITLFKIFLKSIKEGVNHPHPHWHRISKTYNMPDIEKQNITQLDGLTDLDGRVMINRILKIEESIKDWEIIRSEIQERTGVKIGSLPHINRSKRSDYRQYYDEESYQLVKELFHADIKYFNYQF